MTTGTVLAFIFSGITVAVAIVGGIWMEARMPVPDRLILRGRHHR